MYYLEWWTKFELRPLNSISKKQWKYYFTNDQDVTEFQKVASSSRESVDPYLLVYQKLDPIDNVPSLYNVEANNRPNNQSNSATNAEYQVHTLFENS